MYKLLLVSLILVGCSPKPLTTKECVAEAFKIAKLDQENLNIEELALVNIGLSMACADSENNPQKALDKIFNSSKK